MDRAHDFHFVDQMPRRSAAEVDRQDATYDRQVLLNESWASYCLRLGRPAHVAGEERSKWETESWAEYEARIVVRAAYLQDYAKRQDAEALTHAQQLAAVSARAALKVRQIASADGARIAAHRLDAQHSLLLDFEDLRAERERNERADLEKEEAAARARLIGSYTDEFNALRSLFSRELTALLEELEARRLAAEAEAQRQREERMRREQAAREAEERRRREAEEAEKRRREAEEEAKRAERRRKDEERRLKAKAEREAARGGGAPGLGGTVSNASMVSGLNETVGSVASPQDDTAEVRAARDAREKRMLADMAAYQSKFVAQCQSIKKQAAGGDADGAASAMSLALKAFVDDVGAGRVLFHTAVYVGLTNEAVALTEIDNAAAAAAHSSHAHLNFVVASENCNSDLRSGHVALDMERHAGAPCVAHCMKASEPTPVLDLTGDAAAHIVRLDARSPPAQHSHQLGEGYFFAAPVKPSSSPSDVYGTIIIDTASHANTRDPDATLQPAEAKCYTSAGLLAAVIPGRTFDDTASTDINTSFASGTTARGVGAVPILPQTQDFIVACGVALGDALAAIRSSRKASNVPRLLLEKGATTSLNALYAGICNAIRTYFAPKMVGVYVARLAHAAAPDATIVCNNGVCVGDVAAGSDPLLGQSIHRPDEAGKKGAALPKMPPTFALQQAPNTSNDSILVPDVSDAASGCVSYRGVPPPHGEALIVIPLRDGHNQLSVVIGVTCASEDGGAGLLAPHQAALTGFVSGPVRDAFDVLLQRQITAALCDQAVDWMCLTTGAANAYLAIKEGEALRIVAASESQKAFVGRTWASGGVALPWLQKAVPANSTTNAEQAEGLVLRVKKLNDPAASVLILREGLRAADIAADAEMIMAVVTMRHNVAANERYASAPVHGVLVVDTVAAPGAASTSKKGNAFTDADKEMLRTTAFLLAEAMSGSHLHEGHKLAIDKVVDPSRLAFLKRVYAKVSGDVKAITANQLSEMSRYNNPPPIIPTVCSATLIATGVKPTTVETWDETRKKLSQALVDKMAEYDPTSLKVKKAFFTRSRKMTTGLTAADVFSKGSYPASCFFAWTFATILLRKAADTLRRRAKAGLLDADASVGAMPEDDDATSASATDGGAAGDHDDDATDEE